MTQYRDTYADHCEEPVQGEAKLLTRPCKGKGLHVTVHGGGPEYGVMVRCAQHARKAWMSNWAVDWEETARVFGTTPSKGRKADRIGGDAVA